MSRSWPLGPTIAAQVACPREGVRPRVRAPTRGRTSSWTRDCYSLLFLGSTQHGGGGNCRIAGLNANVDDNDFARLDRRYGFLEGCNEVAGLGHRAKPLRAL